MGILDGIVGWIAEQVMSVLDMISISVLGALGCDMDIFIAYFPAAETLYTVFVALGLGICLLNWVWQLFRNFGLGVGLEAEDPLKLTLRTVLFILLILYARDIVDVALGIGGTPYDWILSEEFPPIDFASFSAVLMVLLGVLSNGGVILICLIVVIVIGFNYLKLLLEAGERYVLLAVLVFTCPIAFAMGASQSTANIFKSWCRMLGGQIFLILMNAWCLRLFTNMVGAFIANPLMW